MLIVNFWYSTKQTEGAMKPLIKKFNIFYSLLSKAVPLWICRHFVFYFKNFLFQIFTLFRILCKVILSTHYQCQSSSSFSCAILSHFSNQLPQEKASKSCCLSGGPKSYHSACQRMRNIISVSSCKFHRLTRLYFLANRKGKKTAEAPREPSGRKQITENKITVLFY